MIYAMRPHQWHKRIGVYRDAGVTEAGWEFISASSRQPYPHIEHRAAAVRVGSADYNLAHLRVMDPKTECEYERLGAQIAQLQAERDFLVGNNLHSFRQAELSDFPADKRRKRLTKLEAQAKLQGLTPTQRAAAKQDGRMLASLSEELAMLK